MAKQISLTFYVGHKPHIFQKVGEEETWRLVMQDEIHNIQKNNTCQLVTIPPQHKRMGIWKELDKNKHKVDGDTDPYKARS